MEIILLVIKLLVLAVYTAGVAWIIWAATACFSAYFNRRGLRRPDFIARYIQDIDWNELWAERVRILVFDVDNTLCPTYKDLTTDTVAFLRMLKKMGFDIWLASKSNPNMQRIEQQVDGVARVYWPENNKGIKKPQVEFFNTFTRQTYGDHYVAFIGDKLTDLGKRTMLYSQNTVSILVNPLGKDLRGENSLMLRRVRERFTLLRWRIKRYHPKSGKYTFMEV